jgi:hypothetical protein
MPDKVRLFFPALKSTSYDFYPLLSIFYPVSRPSAVQNHFEGKGAECMEFNKLPLSIKSAGIFSQNPFGFPLPLYYFRITHMAANIETELEVE